MGDRGASAAPAARGRADRRATDRSDAGAVAVTARGRAVAIDLGERRIGVAVCDSARTLASPRTTVNRTGDRQRDLVTLVGLALEEEATVVVVGHPLSLDGSRGKAAAAAEDEAAALGEALASHGVAVELFDERLTTVTAERSLRAGGRGGRERRKVIDRSAAAVLLQAWIDAQGEAG